MRINPTEEILSISYRNSKFRRAAQESVVFLPHFLVGLFWRFFRTLVFQPKRLFKYSESRKRSLRG